MTVTTRLRLPAILAAISACPAFAAPPTGSITRHVWTGVGGTEISNLTSLGSFPNTPSQTGTLTSFNAPRDTADDYGTRVFGWVHAPVTGNYRFYIHSDDSSELWLSTDESPEGKRKVAGVAGWVNYGSWNSQPDQASAVIPLQAGRYYYIEALHKEGGGGDHLGVGWTYPGQSSIAYIPGSRLSAWQNVAPVARADHFRVRPGTTTILRVLDNDIDPNGRGTLAPTTLAITTPPSQGTATVQPGGRLHYTPSASAPATDSLTYEIRDTSGLASTATVTLEVTSAMRLPLDASRLPDGPPPQTLAAVNAFPNLAFSEPLALATPPGETDRLFVVEKTGDIEVIPSLSAANPVKKVFLDLDAIVNARTGQVFQTGGEQGLLGLAFHPQYATNRRFFVFYSVNIGGVRHQRLSEFATSAADPDLAVAGSEKILIQQADDYDNHNGGDVHFGNDGYLYASFGDEGNQDDAGNNSQRINKDFWSSIIRVDVDFDPANYDGSPGMRPNNHAAVVINAATNRPNYKVPADNPWVGATSFNGQGVTASTVRTEFWAVGLRNPWRFSFDRPTGDLWCGDVGGGSWEEINRITRGGNYEWAYREGNSEGPKWSSRPVGWTGAQRPVYAYGHGSGSMQGNSVTGGVLYRGERIPSLTGRYIFADYVSANIWAMNPATAAVERITGEGGIAGFGLDPSNGDVLLADLNGQVRRLVSQAEDSGFPATLDATGLFADVPSLTPAAGMVAYDVNLPFWSDHAKKRRWFGVPGSTATFGFQKEGAWETPAGTVWVKHFDLELERGNPSTSKRLETRVFVRTSSGAYGVSYRWNEAGTAATLVDEAGVEFDLAVTEGGAPVTQRWRIPSRAECMTCHSPQAGHSLSFRTRQLNLAGEIAEQTGNMIDLLAGAGYLTGLDEEPEVLPRHVAVDDGAYALETRARAWLEVNCSYCHMAGGTAPATFDLRAELPLFATNTVNVPPTGGALDPQDRLITPGEEEHSVLVHRSAGRNGYSRMPPLATSVTDAAGIALLQAWIENALPGRESYDTWSDRELSELTEADRRSEADPDGDGRDNRAEFLAGTNPAMADAAPAPSISREPGGLWLTYSAPSGRGVLLEQSTNLTDWSTWPGAGNDGLERNGDSTWLVPIEGPQRFYRARLEER